MAGLVGYASSSSSEDEDGGARQSPAASATPAAQARSVGGALAVESAPQQLGGAIGGAIVAHGALGSAPGGPAHGPANPFAHQPARLAPAAPDEAAFHSRVHERMPTASAGLSRRQRAQAAKLAEAVAREPEAPAGVPAVQKRFLEDHALRGEQRKKRREEEEAEEERAKETHVMRGEELAATVSSTFYGTEEVDYQGRAWTVPPATLRAASNADQRESAVPQRLLHVWKGHRKGVQAIEFSPQYAHLLLSGSLDGSCRIWGCYESTGGGNGRGVKRVYEGHEEPVRTVAFDSDGACFASSGYDKRVVFWDVETGQASLAWHAGATANAVKFVPEDSNVVLGALSNSEIHQFDRREGKVVQRYEHHLSAVDTLTFYDRNRRFVSTSDDKVMLAWELNIPVPIKYEQDPAMQSMPVVRHHPSANFIACQSMDNQILTYSVGDRVRRSKKTFRGHNNAGFACAIDFSPDGNFLTSGDSTGKLFFWNWRSGKRLRQIDAHRGNPCLGVRWHPIEGSWVATCAWDGLIKLWSAPS